jgi:hypothetical protein
LKEGARENGRFFVLGATAILDIKMKMPDPVS